MSGAMPLTCLYSLDRTNFTLFVTMLNQPNAQLLNFFLIIKKYLPHVSSLKGSFQERPEDEPLRLKTFRRYVVEAKIEAGVHLVVLPL